MTPAGLTAGGLPDREAGAVLAPYLREEATAFLRALAPREGELGRPQDDTAESGRRMRRSARRIAGTLHTFGSLTDPGWADPLRAELGWLTDTLGREHRYAARLGRLIGALQRLASAEDAGGIPAAPLPADDDLGLWLPVPTTAPDPAAAASEASRERPGGVAEAPEPLTAVARAAANRRSPAPPQATERGAAASGPLAVGAARAGALLERQLTLARTRAHSAALQAMGSSRFHAVVDAVAVLASEVPLSPAARKPAATVLPLLAEQAHARLTEAAAALPLPRARHPYNGETLHAALAGELPTERQDAAWNRVRVLLRLRRYAQEVLAYDDQDSAARLAAAARVLEQHREAAEAAAAVTAAARTPRIAPATAYALGVLHSDQRLEVEAARYAFAHLWTR
ncbi:CHAD domain-containing protein [Actinacidiphila sp. bgisy160]|uniref:CHAD domain-containing protein n=1 Tax=Actinacidiphila sp. bgisy160 TaxID=3413796 RepID=UPI003D7197C6